MLSNVVTVTLSGGPIHAGDAKRVMLIPQRTSTKRGFTYDLFNGVVPDWEIKVTVERSLWGRDRAMVGVLWEGQGW